MKEYNLQEKYDRGQKDFSEEQYKKLEEFVKETLKNEGYMLGDLLWNTSERKMEE